MNFKLHFLKEKERELDIKGLKSFFEKYPDVTIQKNETEFMFVYSDKFLENEFVFSITPKSTIDEIHLVDPAFLDLKFRFEIGPLFPKRKMEIAVDIINKLCKTFEYKLYSNLMKNVFEANFERIEVAYELFNKIYLKQNPEKIKEYLSIDKIKLNSILKYQSEKSELERFYTDDELIIPGGYFMMKDGGNDCYFAINWQEQSAVVFPPYLDLICLDNDNYVDFRLIQPYISKYLTVLPGYSLIAYQVTGKNVKKVWKAVHKEVKAIFPFALVPISNKLLIEK